jgi:hypothetical protein
MFIRPFLLPMLTKVSPLSLSCLASCTCTRLLGDDLGLVDFSSSAEEKEKEKDRDDKEREKEREPLLWSGDVLRLTQVCPLSCHAISCQVMFAAEEE